MMKFFYLNLFLFFLWYGTSLSAQPIIQQDDFNAENERLNWAFENTHLLNPINWEFTQNNGANIDGTAMAYFQDDGTMANESVGMATLTAPTIDIAGAIYAEIFFDYNYQHYSSLTLSTNFRVEVFDGINWQRVWERTEDDCGAWEDCNTFNRARIDVKDHVNANFQVRFVYDDGSLVGFFAAVDNYELRVALNCTELLPQVSYRLIDECPSSARTYTCEYTVSNLIEGESIGIDIFNEGSLFAKGVVSANGTYVITGIPECTYTEVRRDCALQANKYGCDCDDFIFDFLGEILCCEPLNDDCVGAIDMGSGSLYTYRMPNSATNSGFDSACENDQVNKDIWFTRPAPATGYLKYGIWGTQFVFLERTMYSEIYTGNCNDLTRIASCGLTNQQSSIEIENLPTTGDLYFRVWVEEEGENDVTELRFQFDEDPCNALPLFDASVQVADCESSLEYQVIISVENTLEPVDILVNGESAHLEVSGGVYEYFTAPASDGTMLVEVRQTNQQECIGSVILPDPCNLCEPPRNDECNNAEFIGTTIETIVTIDANIECSTEDGEDNLPTCDGITPPSGGVWYLIEGSFNDIEQPRGIRVTVNEGHQIYAFAGGDCSFGCPSVLSGQGTSQVVFLANNQTANKNANASLSYYIYVIEEGSTSNLNMVYESKSGTFAPALPLHWLDFNIKTQGDSNELVWQVAAQQNVAYYQVERSAYGTNNWDEIGKITANNLPQTQQYQFIDNRPLLDSYYRITSVDRDGLTSVSPIRNIVRIKENEIQLSPNPVVNELFIKWNQSLSTTLDIQIFDLNGQQLLQSSVAPTHSAPSINIENLPAGVYLIQVSDGKKQRVQRIVKQ